MRDAKTALKRAMCMVVVLMMREGVGLARAEQGSGTLRPWGRFDSPVAETRSDGLTAVRSRIIVSDVGFPDGGDTINMGLDGFDRICIHGPCMLDVKTGPDERDHDYLLNSDYDRNIDADVLLAENEVREQQQQENLDFPLLEFGPSRQGLPLGVIAMGAETGVREDIPNVYVTFGLQWLFR
ncbi:MAG: hypothetical protein ACM3VT_20280 [Solirubrobacterales bacterium]